jgi:uncharacterized protein YpuA (DUF1002 family)
LIKGTGETAMKKYSLLFFSFILLMAFPFGAWADVTAGDKIVTVGQDLTPAQRTQILNELGATNSTQIVTVTNQEEQKYLGNLVPKAMIGTRSISSSSITYTSSGSGLNVSTHNITWVTNQMYLNALTTAGVKDANIVVTAPFPVSGTAALTGIMKAYEMSSGTAIPDNVKQAANTEMVQTAKLGDQIGANNAAKLVAKVKSMIAQNPPQNDAQLRDMINQAAKELGITLTDSQVQALVDLFDKLKSLNINWQQVGDQINKAANQVTNYLHSPQGQTFLDKLKEFLVSLINAVKSLFS